MLGGDRLGSDRLAGRRAGNSTAAERGVEALYCLGDLGGFGPSPERVRALLSTGKVRVIQGNYEQSLAAGNDDSRPPKVR